MPERAPKLLTRRTVVGWLGIGGLLALGGGTQELARPFLNATPESAADRPTRQQEILKLIETLNFAPGSALSTTFMPRKIAWEAAEHLDRQGKWEGGDKSNWRNHPELITEAVADLQKAGITSVRLAILPFELTRDGQNFDWHVLDQAITIMEEHGISFELCVGPWDYPYDPGIRLPIYLEDQLKAAREQTSATHLTIDPHPDPNFPEVSTTIKEFGFNFFADMITKYQDNPNVTKICIGNEWGNTHGIEGSGLGGLTMDVSKPIMLELVKIAKELTDKPIYFNTNIHASNPDRMVEQFGEIAEVLGSQFVLALDVYPTREAEDFFLRTTMDDYQPMIEELRHRFPLATIVFGEFQAEPYIVEQAGQDWARIYAEHPEIIIDFFENVFPEIIQTHIIPTGITEVGLWLPPLTILANAGYDFPIKMFAKIAERMAEINANSPEVKTISEMLRVWLESEW